MIKIFSGSSNRSLALQIAKKLNTNLSELEEYVFPDGEKRIRVLERVVDEDTFIVQSTATPTDQNYMELFFIIDALKRSGAKSVAAIIPYLGYQRQDHIFRSGEAVSLQVVIKTLEATGLTRVIIFDLHSIKTPELFSIPVNHLSAVSIFAQKIKEEGWDKADTVLVAPDAGGARRTKIVANLLGNLNIATIIKNRDLKTGKVTVEDIKGKILPRVIIIDDMISTGGTIISGANVLQEKGARDIIVFATHAVFSKEAPTLLEESNINKIFVTDTINLPKEKQFSKLQVLSVADMIVQQIQNL